MVWGIGVLWTRLRACARLTTRLEGGTVKASITIDAETDQRLLVCDMVTFINGTLSVLQFCNGTDTIELVAEKDIMRRCLVELSNQLILV